jgi:hypothetical protein
MECGIDGSTKNRRNSVDTLAAGNGAGRPDLLLPHLHEVLIEPILHPLTVVGRVACALCAGMFPCSLFSCSHKLTRVSRSSRSNIFVLISFYFRKLDSYWSPIAHSLIQRRPAQGPETLPALVAPCWFIFAGKCTCTFLFVYGSSYFSITEHSRTSIYFYPSSCVWKKSLALCLLCGFSFSEHSRPIHTTCFLQWRHLQHSLIII